MTLSPAYNLVLNLNLILVCIGSHILVFTVIQWHQKYHYSFSNKITMCSDVDHIYNYNQLPNVQQSIRKSLQPEKFTD